jgi:hypothetical protein
MCSSITDRTGALLRIYRQSKGKMLHVKDDAAKIQWLKLTPGTFNEECRGTFLSYFPIEKYFEQTPYSDIKFGI